MDIVQKEVGVVFSKVLEHAGVFKRDEAGKTAFLRFAKGAKGPQAKPSEGRFRRAEPAGPGGAGAACGRSLSPAETLPEQRKYYPTKEEPI